MSENPINLGQNGIKTILIIPDEGYYRPRITYKENTYEIGEPFEGDIFTVEYSRANNNNYSFIIRAKQGVFDKCSDYIDIDVEMIPEELWSLNRNATRSSALRVNINVISNTKEY